MRARHVVLAVAAVVLILAVTTTAMDLHPGNWFKKELIVTPPAAGAQAPLPAQPLAPGPSPNYRAIVQQGAPAVVGITVAGQHTLGTEDVPLDLNDPFFQFFRGLPGFQLRDPRLAPGGKVPFRGQGSGFIIASDGLILTNAHVVREAKEVLVRLNDRREFRAQVLGADVATDIAVLRIDAKNLPVVRLGDPQQLQVGDPVLAIGSPYGFEQSATQGIVSAKGRSLPGDAAVPYIQTDAAVNPGNSGGPLFDASGAVVGINAQIYSQSGGFQGLSFAIPISVALKIKDQILATGHASHARLGVTVQDLTQSLAASFGLKQANGALISNVQPNGAAASAGLQAGDVITEINGEAIERSGELSSRISLESPGTTVTLKVWRDGALRTVQVKLGQAVDANTAEAKGRSESRRSELGLSLRKLTREETAATHLQSGLVVEAASGPAAQAGLMPGDVVLSVNGVALTSVEQMRWVLEKKPKNVALLIWRDGERVFVSVELE